MRDKTLTDQQRFEMICVAKRKAEVPMHLGWSFFLLFAGFIGVLALLGTIFWVWMIVDCATNEPPEGNNKVMQGFTPLGSVDHLT